jgi:serine/threonine protein kinase
VDEDAIAPLWKGQKFPMSACVSGLAVQTRQPVVIPDIHTDPRVPHDVYRPTFVKSLVMVPIRTLDPVGAIGNYWATPHTPTDEEVRLLQALADSTAVAMENVRVISELEDRVKARTAELEETNLRLTETNADLLAAQEQTNRVFAAYSHALVGTVLDGKYRVDEELGSGGFGVVFRGHHLTLDQPVAVKVFRPRPGNDSGSELQRFLREGATAARLNHPNVVRVFDSAVSADGIAYLVMELLHGHTLGREVSQDGPLAVKRAVRIGAAVAGVLAAAHRAGIVHRDIKPENVFLHTDGGQEAVKVVDFGIARPFGGPQAAAAARFTRTGAFVGTPAFVAPELMTGAEDDGRSDVFSLGVVLYHALTGVLPWTEQQLNAGLVGLVPAAPRAMGEFRTDVPPELAALVSHALAWKPTQRLTAGELADALRHLGEKLPDRPPRLDSPNTPLPRAENDEFWISALR